MAKIIFNNKNYNIDDSALAPAMAALEEHLRSMAGGGSDEPAAGLYKSGTNYTELITSWDELLANGTVHVDNGVVYTNFDTNEWENASSDALIGDLMLPNDGSITSLSDSDIEEGTGNAAFTHCMNLTGIKIPDGVTSIGSYAFYFCTNLTSITIPDSVTSIGDFTFVNCTNLTGIIIPDGVTSIGDETFADCTSFTSVTIPDSVTSIGGYAFGGCTNLVSVIIPDSVTSIDRYAFRSCTNLVNITFTGTVNQWNAIDKDPLWNSNKVPATHVQCSDGQVSLLVN